MKARRTAIIAGLHGNGMVENVSEVIENYDTTFDRLINEVWGGGAEVVDQEIEEEWNSDFMRKARQRVKQGMRVVSLPGEQAIGQLPD